MARRDDFSPEAKRALAARVGLLCSNPDCRAPTSGPQSDPAKAVNIGVAAHITAASPGGARYDAGLSAEERASATNGIWACQNCGKRIDNDEARYTVELLRAWKVLAESRADQAMGKTAADTGPNVAPVTAKGRAVAAVAAGAPNAAAALRTFMSELAKDLGTTSKRIQQQRPPTANDFSSGIVDAKPLVRDLIEVATTVAEFDADLAVTIAKGFEPIVELYEASGAGTWWNSSFDIAKFVGHELFLALAAVLIRLERWPALSSVLSQTFFARRNGQKRPLTYVDILSDVSLTRAQPSAGTQISPHGEALRSRYEDDDMKVSFRELVDADYLLYLASPAWWPVTVPYMKETPDWLARCQSESHLRAMLEIFGSKDPDDFRRTFAKFRLPQFQTAFMLNHHLIKPEAIGAHP